MAALSPVQQKFILHWGEMGIRWGINRTVAQIHALLFISPKPLNAEEIAATLDVARSNVSNSLKELQGWGIVKRVHVLGRFARSFRKHEGCLGNVPRGARRAEETRD
jgi:DNA-binding transcriptional regulator GbsR (MarR family)